MQAGANEHLLKAQLQVQTTCWEALVESGRAGPSLALPLTAVEPRRPLAIGPQRSSKSCCTSDSLALRDTSGCLCGSSSLKGSPLGPPPQLP